MAPCTSCFFSRSSNCRSQHFCDVCKYMFRMDWANGHNNQCSNCEFKVYAFCHHCSTAHKVPNRLGSTMLCLSDSSLSNTSHHSFAHHLPTTVNNQRTFFEVTMICMTMMIVQLAMLLTMTATVCIIPVTAMSHSPFSKVLVVPMEIQMSSSMDWLDVSSTTTHPRTRLGLYLTRQMTFLSLLNSRYHHHPNWTWVHMSLSSCCSKMKTFCHLASLTKSWNGPAQLLLRVTSLMLQATPHWNNK